MRRRGIAAELEGQYSSSDGEGHAAARAQLEEQQKVRRRRRRQPQSRTNVLLEQEEEENPQEPSPRFRARGGGGGGGKARRQRNAADSDNEQEVDEDNEEWQQDLEARGNGDLMRAFALKPCDVKEIRQLQDEAFLGGKKCPGALPLFNLERKVSLQFLLATYKASEKGRERKEDALALHRPFLRWLLKKARQLQLLSSKEVRGGKIAAARLDHAQRSGSWALDSNLAEASDEEGRKKASERKDPVQQQLDVRFPEQKRSSEGAEEVAELLRQRLRCRVESKKDQIEANSSHGLDLQKMSDRLTAPSLSFDWHAPDSDEEDSSKGILQVELPPSAQSSEGRRALLREEIRRSVSFKQAKELSKGRSTSSFSAAELSAPDVVDVRAAATPTKAKKRRKHLSEATTEPEPNPSAAPEEDSQPRDADKTEVSAPPAEAATPGTSAITSVTSVTSITSVASVTSAASTAASVASVAASTKVDVTNSDAPGLAAASQSAGDFPEISPTLPFEIDAEELKKASNAGPEGFPDISPTLPFDIDASALREMSSQEAPQPAEQAEQHQVQATPSSAKEAEVAETEEELEEDAEDPRQKRERAWLRHKRQAMEAAATQEDDLFAPRPKKRIRSILMAGIA
mmetsp:Transcript_50631/g.120810  ORF Transcript_50631/g.120810 Transcript_50631/m.120810 type:complete len:630 (-) Transcript_50631:101-1990(-)